MISDSITFENLARQACSRLGWAYEELTTVQWRQLRTELSAALRWAWEAYWFEGTIETRQCSLRPEWDNSTLYPARAEIYHAASDAYYTSLQNNLAVDPATLGNDGEWTTNALHWAARYETTSESAWAVGEAYEVGDRVRWNSAEYGCISPHTSTTALLPSNTANWGIIPAFADVLPWVDIERPVIGKVRRVCTLDPRAYPESENFRFGTSPAGIVIRNLTVTRPWIVYRVRCPELTGDAYDPAALYTPEPLTKAVWGTRAPAATWEKFPQTDGVSTRMHNGKLQIKNLDNGLWYDVVARDAGGIVVYSLEGDGEA